MTEASRVQKLLAEQNAEIDRLKNRIDKLETALREIECKNTFPLKIAEELGHKCGPFAIIARKALEGKE